MAVSTFIIYKLKMGKEEQQHCIGSKYRGDNCFCVWIGRHASIDADEDAQIKH